MGDNCEIILDKEIYKPGDVLSGRIDCNFLSETTIKAVRVKINGIGKVSWKVSRYTYHRAQEIYLEMETNLISEDTLTSPGSHNYPFTFNLPSTLPSTMSDGNPNYFRDVVSFIVPLITIEVHWGCIEYTISATIERSWALNYEMSKPFTISSVNRLNTIEGIEKPLEISKAIRPSSILKDSGPITVTINVPKGGYALTENIVFSTLIKNASTIEVQYIQFNFVQGFVFHAEEHTKSIDSVIGDDYVIKDSSVACGNEKRWNLELKIPSDMFLGNYTHSNIIKVFWELRGEISLPFPTKSFTVRVPLTLGPE